MKRLILCAIALTFAAAGYCQGIAKGSDTAKKEWLQTFTSVEIDAPIEIVFIQSPDNEPPKMIYDTHGNETSKFQFEVKKHVLRITERTDSKRTDRTSVTLYYNTLESVSVNEANARFNETITAQLFDVSVGARASLTAEFDVQDLVMELSGRNSSAVLEGSSRYLTLFVSNGTVEAMDLKVMAARVNVSSGGKALVDVSDRLEVTTSTNGRMSYKSEPALIRHATRFLGGNIEQFSQQ